MKIIHFCAGLQGWNGMANTARQFVAEEVAAGHDSKLTDRLEEISNAKVGKEGLTCFAKIDVVHIHGAWLPAVHKAAKRAKEMGAKLIIRPAGSYDPVRRHFHGWKKLLMAPWEHAMLRRADVVQATCPQEAEWIREYHPSVHVELTDLKRFFRFESKCEVEVEGRSDRSLHVLYLGRRHPLKGVAYLRQAVAEVNGEAISRSLQQKKDSSTFKSGQETASPLVELREVSDTCGEELEKIWQWCDVLCLPTLSENFGRVVAESLEHGRPVITTDGAPAWYNLKPTQGIYLKGYREGSDAERVKLLKDALIAFIG